MTWDNLDKVLSNCKDYHIPSYILIFGVGSALQWMHHMDTTFVGFVALILGAITGHQFGPGKGDGNTPPTP
jgi:hypothetical protein